MAQLSEEEQLIYTDNCRAAGLYLDKFERYECQELLSFTTAHWMLSNDVFRLPVEPLNGIVSTISPKENTAVILFPVNSESSPICYREIHTIVRELTLGIYVFNQTPTISLEPNYDLATVCNIPPAYLDTRVGQLLTNVDYMMKALWHGVYLPREKRMKFAERWRESLDVGVTGKPETRKPLVTEFVTAGLMDITKDPEYAHAYDHLPKDIPDNAEIFEERLFFMNHVDDLAMNLTFSQDIVEYYKNMYIVNAKYYVSSIVRLLDNNIDSVGFERLKTRLQMHENLLQNHLAAKQETRRQLELLKFISYLVPFFMGMRKRMKIPDMNQLLPPISSDKCRTEREFPPLILPPEFKCQNFKSGDNYFHLHGGISFDLETSPMIKASDGFISNYPEVIQMAENEFQNHFLDYCERDYYQIPICTINEQSYYAIVINFETYYGMAPQRPLWVKAYVDEMEKLKPTKLPITDTQMHEQFKKNFGMKKAIKYKTPSTGIKICAKRGMVSMFNAVCRKVTGNKLGINKQDEQGLSLIHYAAMYNRPQIISRLLLNSVDINVCRNNILAKGPTALHLAARCGSLDAVSCLMSNHAKILAVDNEGWAAIHHAAFFDHQIIVKLMIRRNPEILDLLTKNELLSTPLLLAASSGALSAVKCLIGLKAEVGKRNSEGNNMVSLAALHFHTNVLEYLIERNHQNVNVWKILVEMLSDDNFTKKDSAVKCMEVLSASNSENWKNILAAGAIPILVKLLPMEILEIQSMAASLLCNISEHEPVRVALSAAEAIPPLIKLLSSPVYDIHSQACIILSDIALIDNNQTVIAENGGIAPLVKLLNSEMEDVLVNAANAIRVVCQGHKSNQDTFAKCQGFEYLAEFLEIASNDLKAGAAAALASAIQLNKENQNYALKIGVAKPLVDLVKSNRSVTIQVKAARAMEALATNNVNSQKLLLDLDAPKSLIRLLKNQHVEVREQGACSLWALAGNTRTQQRYIAERTTVLHIVQMLLEPTEKLLYVGCMIAIAFGIENMANQNKLAAADAFSQLIRLLRSPKTSQKVLHMVVKVLGVLCLGVAYKNNVVSQRKIAEEGGITILTQLLLRPPSRETQVEVAITLGCVTLSFKENQEKLADEPHFSFNILLSLLKQKNPEIQLRAGLALTLFAFNNTPQQYNMREAGGIKYSLFKGFIESPDDFFQCYGAFQTIVLARVIVDKDQISLTAQGIEILVQKIGCEDKVAVLTCSLLSSLAHMRSGLSDAMVSVGILNLLVEKLNSENEMVRNAAAVTLGYLTFNKTASRLLFSICRNTPKLYQLIINNIGPECRIDQVFMQDFRRATAAGLPTQNLRFTPAIQVLESRQQSRKQTSFIIEETQQYNLSDKNRAKSAPTQLGMQNRKLITSTNALVDKNIAETSCLRPSSTTANISSKISGAKIRLGSHK